MIFFFQISSPLLHELNYMSFFVICHIYDLKNKNKMQIKKKNNFLSIWWIIFF